MRAFVTGTSLVLCLSTGLALAPLHSQDSPPSLEGAKVLFDGKSLSGWTTVGGRYDGKARWTVREGCIVGQVGPKGEGGLLYTQRPYADFVFACEVKIDYPFDSGIFLGMEPRSQGRRGWQVTLDHRPKGEIGGIYSDGWLRHNPGGEKAFKKNEWNQVIVRSRGFPPRIEVWVGKTKILDHQEKGEEGFAPIGRIGIQVHGARKSWWKNKVRFKNLKLRELPSHNPLHFQLDSTGRLSLTPKGKALGWTPMLENLKAWILEGKEPSPFLLNKSVLSFLAEGAGKNLWTRERFKNFELRLDFKLSPSANSGIFLGGSPGPSGRFRYSHEIQILDDWSWEKDHKAKLKAWQHCGSLYGVSPPRLSALLPPGAWNSYQIRYQGGRLHLRLNGRLIQDLDLLALEKKGASRALRTGALGFQIHGGGRVNRGPYLWIKNFFLRRIE